MLCAVVRGKEKLHQISIYFDLVLAEPWQFPSSGDRLLSASWVRSQQGPIGIHILKLFVMGLPACFLLPHISMSHISPDLRIIGSQNIPSCAAGKSGGTRAS